MLVLSCGSILYRANQGSLRTLESVQRKATRWIMGYNSDAIQGSSFVLASIISHPLPGTIGNTVSPQHTVPEIGLRLGKVCLFPRRPEDAFVDFSQATSPPHTAEENENNF